MTADDIRAAVHAKPFRPFHLTLADGTTQLEVTHPDNLILGAASAVVVLWDNDRTQSQLNIVGLPMITRITFPFETHD